jgi:Fic family protein
MINKIININDIKITSEILSIIAEIDEFKGAWKHLGKISPERLSKLKKVATIESIGSSNRIEGNKLTDREIEELLSKINKQSFASRDEQEVAGYAKLMEIIFDDWEIIPFNENYIKQFHKILLSYSEKDEKHRGDYKKLNNNVAAYDADGKEIGIVFETTTPFETPLKMKELILGISELQKNKLFHSLIITAVFIVHFLAIHPFQDGNGRLSRVLTTLLLLQSGYSYVPYSSIEAIVEENKEAYYRALRQTQSSLKGVVNYEPWILYFLKILQKQKNRLETKIKEKMIVDLSLPKLSLSIMDLLTIKDRITISEIIEETGANYNTVKKHLSRLVQDEYLFKHGKTKGSWYTRKIT